MPYGYMPNMTGIVFGGQGATNYGSGAGGDDPS